MAFRYLSGEAGGIANLGYTETDFNNYMQKRRQTMLSAGDAQTLIDHFKNLQNEDTRFFYTFQLDNDGRMCNVLWRDGVSKLHFDCFGDVIIFDTTYRTNRYNMICAPFVGVNNHWKNIFFGCAFMTNESTSSFVWVFKSFLDSMGGKAPKTIFTDQAYAIGLAIEMVFPFTVHRLCGWHIEKNAKENIPHLFKQVGFKEKYFNKLLCDCESEIEFELTWKNMVDEWECGENTWLQRLYNLREKWCPAFSRCTFSADIKSTQRSESTNRIFNEMGCKMMSLTEFVHHYESKLLEMRNGETEDDYKNRGKPKILVSDCGILNHAATIYTNTIFFRFQEEMLNSISEEVVNFSIEGASRVYTLQRSEDKRTHIVQFDSSNHQTVCSCHKFETLGWLCCHILRVFNTDLRFHSIPMEFVLSRWTKTAKYGLGFDDYFQQKKNTSSSSTTTRLNRLTKKSFAVMSMGAADDVTENIVNRHLDLARAEIISYQGNSSVTIDAITCTQEDIQVGALVNEKGILDPIKRRKKGDTNSRLKSSLEKMKKRKRKYHMTLPQLPVQASKPPFVGGAENFDPNWMSGITSNLSVCQYMLPFNKQAGGCVLANKY